jgi:hypothetical protein
MNKSTPRRTSRLISAGIATGVVAAAIISSPAYAVAATLTLSSTTGPAAGFTIVASSTTAAAFLSGVTAPVSTFSLATCQTVYNGTASTHAAPTSTTAGNVVTSVTTTKMSNSKAMIRFPTTAMPTGVAALPFKVCVYAGSSATDELIGTGALINVATAPTITSVAPAKGPAMAGTVITVNGTNFPTTSGSITATLNGVALTSVTPATATRFTAVTPLLPPGAATLAVTTAAGTITQASAYTYANGIVVSPDTASNTVNALTYIDVFGSGFLSYGFDGAAVWTTPGATTGKPRVYLVDGTYSPGAGDTNNGFLPGVGPAGECGVPVVISDTELVCSINLSTGGRDTTTGVLATAVVPTGIYTVTVVKNGDDIVNKTAAVSAGTWVQTDVSSGATFTVAEYN